MTRCGYIPPDGLSAIAVATARGGTTEGDIQELRDRFGCKAEARWEVSSEASGGPWKEPTCSDHVGHMLHDGANDVRPYEADNPTSDRISDYVTLTITVEASPTLVAASEAFARAISEELDNSSRVPYADFGTPTRKQIEAAGFNSDSATYREALSAFLPRRSS